MLHLVYIMRPTVHARTHQKEFWEWVRAREQWFYDGLDMAQNPRWYVHTIGQHVHCIEHSVAFLDEAAWGTYRAEVHQRAKEPAWEERRVEQDKWWDIIDARLMNEVKMEHS